MFKVTVVSYLPNNERWENAKTYTYHNKTHLKWTIEDYKFKSIDGDLYIKPMATLGYIMTLPADQQLLMERIAVVKDWESQEVKELVEFVCNYNGHFNKPLAEALNEFAKDEALRKLATQMNMDTTQQILA